jgi:hypothetical protein
MSSVEEGVGKNTEKIPEKHQKPPKTTEKRSTNCPCLNSGIKIFF